MKLYVAIPLFVILCIQLTIVQCVKKMDIDELANFIKPMSKKCKGQTGVADEVLEATTRGEFRRERPLMCYYKCMSILLKIMDKQGNISLDQVQKQLDLMVKEDLAPRIKKIGLECFEEVPPNEDKCEYSFDMIQCGYNKDHTLYFLPI